MTWGYWHHFKKLEAIIKELEEENDKLKQENKTLQEELENSNKMLKDLGVTTFDIVIEKNEK